MSTYDASRVSVLIPAWPNLTALRRYPTLRLVALYMLAGSAWIWLSDRLVGFLVRDPNLFGQVQTYKGWFFVGVTGALLGLLVRRDLRQIEQSQADLRRREARLRLATAVGHVGIWEWDIPSGRLFWNDEVRTIFGFPAGVEDLSLEEFVRAIYPEDREAVMTARRRAAEDHTDYDKEYRILRPNREVRWVTGRGRAEYDDAGRPLRMVGATLDVTESKRTEVALRESEMKFRSIVEQSLMGVYLIQDGRFVYVNPRAAEIFGYTQDEFVALPEVMETVVAEDRPLVREQIRRRITGEMASAHYEFHGRRKDGSVITAEALGSRIEYAGQPAILGTLMDITERKRTEEAMRQLSGRLLHLQDEERRRLARELHDTSAQHIAALALSLAVLQKMLKNNARAEKLCQDSLALAEAAGQEIRTMSYLLHPPLLEAVGLAGAIREYAAGFAQRSGVRVDVAAPDHPPRLAREAELTLFRTCQEGLTNIHRHSGSARARIRLEFQTSCVTLTLQDAGRGIPEEKLALIADMKGALGVGIAGMRERLRQLDGQLEIQSGPGGTTLRATLPLNEATRQP